MFERMSELDKSKYVGFGWISVPSHVFCNVRKMEKVYL